MWGLHDGDSDPGEPGTDSNPVSPSLAGDYAEPPDCDESAVPSPGELPAPVAAARASFASAGGAGARRPKKSARIQGDRLRVHWARFIKHVGNGTAPSTSEMDASTQGTGGSSFMLRPGAGMGAGARRSGTPVGGAGSEPEDAEGVDEVVVDRTWWSDELKSSVVTPSEQGAVGARLEKAATGTGTTSGERSGSAMPGGGGGGTDHDSVTIPGSGNGGGTFSGPLGLPYVMLRYRLWPAVREFFNAQFYEEQSESHYRKETWFLNKSLALWSSLFLILNWILTIATLPAPVVLADKIFFYGISTALTFPILPMVMFDFPRDREAIYQPILTLSVWCWMYYNLITINLCGFYPGTKKHFTCGDKDFLGTFFFVCALPTTALFGLKQKRLHHLMGALVFFILGCILVLRYKVTWYRNMIQSLVFHVFLLYVHYMRESAERRLYILRDQLKVQFRATQKAQVNERKAADSKRRLTSYVFHEVRVPLNTAVLAVQNMAAAGIVAKSQEIEFNALEGSLSMMSKVLNDVLDFNRMDSGRFESVSKPYAFHQVMRSLFVPLRLATNARHLQFTTDLDETIDLIARGSAYQAMGETKEGVLRRLQTEHNDPGMVVGDEMRLRQIVNNLASNACKFTPAGGKLHISTRLIWPTRLPWYTPSSDTMTGDPTAVIGESLSRKETHVTCRDYGADIDLEKGDGSPLSPPLPHVLSSNHLIQHNETLSSAAAPQDKIVVRIEVTDTGCGIREQDMAHNKLFTAFNQTEQGRQQGGKGTGLGLALVRQIVKRSGGRLGVRSKPGVGSTFWVELPLGVGTKAIVGGQDRILRLQTLDVRPDVLDAALADVAPSSAAPKKEARSSARPLTPATLKGIMEQSSGRIMSLPGDKNTNLTLERMTIADQTPEGPPPTVEVSQEPEPSAPPSRDREARPPAIPLPAPVFVGFDHASAATSTDSAVTLHSKSGKPSLPTTPDAGMPVLVVDDDPLTRMLMKRMLVRLGCRVWTAENGEAALEMITGSPRPTPQSEDVPMPLSRLNSTESHAGGGGVGNGGGGTGGGSGGGGGGVGGKGVQWGDESRYAIIFLDNQMPVCSGLEAVAKLRQVGRHDFVVGVTGNALLSDQEEYLEAGADYVLTKPVLEKSLKGMLVLAQQRLKPRISEIKSPELRSPEIAPPESKPPEVTSIQLKPPEPTSPVLQSPEFRQSDPSSSSLS